MTHEQRIAEIRETLKSAWKCAYKGEAQRIHESIKQLDTLAAECLRLREASAKPMDFSFCARCGVQMNPKVDTSGVNVDELLKDKERLDWVDNSNCQIQLNPEWSEKVEIDLMDGNECRTFKGVTIRQALDAAKGVR